ncbi:MAG: hypothetical protein U0573_01705 [Phycisphaerales bacterium]|nr:hypothetical protein [Planctomycetota bacterium]
MKNARLYLIASPALCAAALAGPLGTGFTSGNIRAAGFPDPLRQNTLAPVGPKSGSGGGSTGGGFGGFATTSVGITDSDDQSSIAVSGYAFHPINDGYTASYTQTPITLALTKSTKYTIAENSSVDYAPQPLVTFEALTGDISPDSPTSGTLSAGIYKISYGVAAGLKYALGSSVVSPWYPVSGAGKINSASLDWKISLKPMLQSYLIGNPTFATSYYVWGQSFTPSTFGMMGTQWSPKATPKLVKLSEFTINFDYYWTDIPPTLSIFDAPPTLAQAASGAGSRATGVHVGNGTYRFTDAVLDYHTKYYAVLPYPANMADSGYDTYTGGVDLFPRLDIDPNVINEGYGTFDIGFFAYFDYLPGCPADLNGDGLVDDSDFVAFANGYNTLDCLDPEMPGGCPANLNNDLVVDDGDFVIFAAAYNDLICP